MAEVVPGITAWLHELKFKGPRAEAIANWAEEQGAISLDELVENLEDLADDLDLKPLERKRLTEGAETAAAKVLESLAAVEAAGEPEEEEEEAAGDDEFNEARMAQLELTADFAGVSEFDRDDGPPPEQPPPRARPPPARAAPPPARAAAKPKAITARGAGKAVDKESLAKDLRKLVSRVYPEFAAQLTEMILELGEEEVQACLDSEEKLAERLEEGLGLLDDDSQLEEGLAVFEKEREPAKGKDSGEERRIDPEDGEARTLREMRAFYAGQYTHQEIDEHWESCEPAKPTRSAPARAEPTRAPPARAERNSAAAAAAGSSGAPSVRAGAPERTTQQKPEAADPEEKRIDPTDGVARTLAELRTACAGQYTEQEIKDYWETMRPVVTKGKGGKGGYAPAAPAAAPPSTEAPRAAPAAAAASGGPAKAAGGLWGAGRGKRRF